MPETTPARSDRATRAKKPAAKAKVAAPQKNAQKPGKVGAPSTYDPHIANMICIMISEGKSLRQILAQDTTGLLPAQSTVYEWLLRHKDFAENYTRAREEQADTLADEIIQIADEQPEIVVVTDKKTGAVIEHKLDGAFLQWQKNRIEARKWTAMKLKPKKYGDRVAVEGVEGGAAIKTEETSSGKLFELIRNLEMTKRMSGKSNT
jgi:hypothetical protein